MQYGGCSICQQVRNPCKECNQYLPARRDNKTKRSCTVASNTTKPYLVKNSTAFSDSPLGSVRDSPGTLAGSNATAYSPDSSSKSHVVIGGGNISFMVSEGRRDVAAQALASSATGGLVIALTNPLDCVKQRWQVERSDANVGLRQFAARIVQQQGLFRGSSGPTDPPTHRRKTSQYLLPQP